MEQNTFFVIEEKEIATGKTFAFATKVNNCNNLYGYFHPCKGFEILSINACDTWKKAQETALFWNQCAKEKGNYALA